MQVTIDINDRVFDNLYSEHCEKSNRDCYSCPSQVVLGDEYDGCQEKYQHHVFKTDLEEKVNEKFGRGERFDEEC